MWTIARIDEVDYGCEERMPGEPLMVLVTLKNEEDLELQLQVADQWLIIQDLNEGDEWPEELGGSEDSSLQMQSDWMDNYLSALEEIEENLNT